MASLAQPSDSPDRLDPVVVVARLYLSKLATSRVTPHLHEGLVLYLAHRRPVGHFLTSVLENNLRETFRTADAESAASLPELLMFLNWDVPAGCWGSPEKVARHLAGRTKGGE